MLYNSTPHLPCTSLYSSEHLVKNFLEMKVRCVQLGRRADNLLGSSVATLAVECQTFPASKSEPYAIYVFPFFVLTGLPVSPSLEVSGRISRLHHEKAQSSPSFEHPFSFLQTLRRWFSVSCSSADIFVSSSPHIGREDAEIRQVSSYSFLF